MREQTAKKILGDLCADYIEYTGNDNPGGKPEFGHIVFELKNGRRLRIMFSDFFNAAVESFDFRRDIDRLIFVKTVDPESNNTVMFDFEDIIIIETDTESGIRPYGD